ncbi:hypothetical protein V1264_003314 [Littorina saxatilis]|uniref:VWFA domain-containing protein n=1 Tax=Littorina saxatilis TaxID=31220 RepID=A0AAN9B563_9CAEN
MKTKNTHWSYLVLLLALFVAPSMQQRSELDLVFVVDGSDSIGQANFETLKQSILNYVVPQMGNGALHVGFVLYSTNLDTVINLTPDVATLTNGVNALDWPEGETNTNIGIHILTV